MFKIVLMNDILWGIFLQWVRNINVSLAITVQVGITIAMVLTRILVD